MKSLRARHEAWREAKIQRHLGRSMGRVECYLQARLHRRMFMYFGAAILCAAFSAFLVMTLLNGSPQRDVVGARTFLSQRFAEAWNEPARVQALADELHDDLSADVTVRDLSGATVSSVGSVCGGFRGYSIPIEKEGAAIGKVSVCTTHLLRAKVTGLASVLAACMVLWLLSAVLSRKIAWNLQELERAAIEIGHGRYEPEIRLDPKAPGEMVFLGDALRDMGAKIKTQMAEQRELLASVSHEIRSPLARIRLLLELSRPSSEPVSDASESAQREAAAREKAIADMEREIDEIDQLVGGLLANSRVDFSALTRRPLDLEDACARAIERAGSKAKLVVTGDKRPAEADATLFARAMANLIENAAAHGNGAEEVDVAFNGESVRVDVLDRGPGLAPGEEEKIFQSFYRRPSKAHESLGLGLSLVRKIAEAHGGAASAKNRDGGGAAIGFDIPLARFLDPAPASA